MPFKPMLALAHEKLYAKDEDRTQLPKAMRFPVCVQPKLDGIRVSIVNGQALTRTLKQLPNREIFEALSRPEYEGLDGEILVGDPRTDDAYRRTASFAMAADKTGEPWVLWVFDKWDHPGTFQERHASVLAHAEGMQDPRVRLVHTDFASDPETLTLMETVCVEDGFEGVICRNPDGRYKWGRGGKSVQELIKVKRFLDFEAEVIGVYEEMHNGNVGVTNALGRTERSTAKAGKTGKDRLGGLYLRALNGPCKGIEFKCGTGFDEATRISLWQDSDFGGAELNGHVAKVKSFPVGVKEKPRHPVFLGWRMAEDMPNG